MKNSNNSLMLTTIMTLFSTAMLLPSVSYAQQLNQARAFLAPASQQDAYFPSEQQIQQALLTPIREQESSFPPLEQEPQVFINQFTTPDAPRVKQTMNFPAAPSLLNKKNNFGSSNSQNPFSFPNTFPAIPFSNNNGTNTGWNKNSANTNNGFPFIDNSNSNKKKAWGDTRNIWPDFYTDFTDTAWDEALSSPRKLGRMPGGWRFPYNSTPDPVTMSDAITNQFPPIAEEAGHLADISKWGVFDGQ